VYKSFFGLKKNPFNVNPDPSYLYLTPQTRRTLDELTYGIETRKGLMLLTGEAGTGKTTLVNHLLLWLEHQRARTAFIFNSHLDSEQLFDFIFSEFEIQVTPQAKANPLLAFNDWLLARYRARDLVVLIVDEGQGLPIHVLEEIRLLSNMELPNEKLLQIILVGQPELDAKLRRPDLRQLQQRIGLRCKTAPLTLEEVAGYIENRLHTAGSGSNLVFEPDAIEAVHNYSGGIPRVINLLCENALINAYVEHTKVISAPLVAEAARDLQFDTFRPVAPPRLRTIGPPSDVAANVGADLHAILAKIKADADAWQEKPRATPYLVSAQKAAINHQGDAFSASESETNGTRVNTLNIPPTSSRPPRPEYAPARVRVWKRNSAGRFLSANLASVRAWRAINDLRSSLDPAIGAIRKYDLEGRLRLYAQHVRLHGYEPTLRSIRNLELESRIRRGAKRVQVHGIESTLRSFSNLNLNGRLKNCAKTVRNVTEPRIAHFSKTIEAGVRTSFHTTRNGAAPLINSLRRWFSRNFNEQAYGKTLIVSFLACSVLVGISLRMNLAHASLHPGRVILGCVGILLSSLYLAAAVPILLRARHKFRADASKLVARAMQWLRAPISPMPTRELSSVAGKIHTHRGT
jgi:general secretion pathway protein A